MVFDEITPVQVYKFCGTSNSGAFSERVIGRREKCDNNIINY